MYMLGRLRTGSRPSSTWIDDSAVYFLGAVAVDIGESDSEPFNSGQPIGRTLLPLAATRSGARHAAVSRIWMQLTETPARRAPLRVAANGNQSNSPPLCFPFRSGTFGL